MLFLLLLVLFQQKNHEGSRFSKTSNLRGFGFIKKSHKKSEAFSPQTFVAWFMAF
jgi:hypothetical protein